LSAKGRQIEASPTRHITELIGAETGSEPVMRYDPAARSLTAAASARHRPQSGAAVPKTIDDVIVWIDWAGK
jgi:hypothetical protein